MCCIVALPMSVDYNYSDLKLDIHNEQGIRDKYPPAAHMTGTPKGSKCIHFSFSIG